MIYVASSWRNPFQPDVVKMLRANDVECYDFRDPMGDGADSGFHWRDAMPTWQEGYQRGVPFAEYRAALNTPVAAEGFGRDWHAMTRSKGCVLVLPCGRSAHLELGFFVGAALPTAILFPEATVVPELMYGMVDLLAIDVGEILSWAIAAK